MAVPKRRTSKSRKNKRRTHQKLAVPGMTIDPETGDLIRSHHVSPSGYYKGRKVLDVKEK
ncbi:MAG: 50S ribosomal protein L32 [Bavariicoccus seileri]|uniref:Large ribosomal subunit protein bL32 n=1 Tax=Bavariicoccus seileri TaxID=549685 RepID=A0A3D4S426_9ENTE|nr:50S ribosomal protein L32 [Bavariicoccus seileri]HCS93563.1 50S ribosomal protein L32 [Bavariicoccus seileri]